MVEPLAVGMQAATRAQIRPGDIGLVIGAGTIGTVTALSAVAGGCSTVVISDIQQEKLEIAAGLGPFIPVNVSRENLKEKIAELTGGWGVDIIFEASGSEAVARELFDHLCPGGRVVYIGMPGAPVTLDIVAAQIREARIETIFRYAHVFPRVLALMEAGKIDVKPLITETFPFLEGVEAFEYACRRNPSSVKVQIQLE
jgi:D-xylulose reductase